MYSSSVPGIGKPLALREENARLEVGLEVVELELRRLADQPCAACALLVTPGRAGSRSGRRPACGSPAPRRLSRCFDAAPHDSTDRGRGPHILRELAVRRRHRLQHDLEAPPGGRGRASASLWIGEPGHDHRDDRRHRGDDQPEQDQILPAVTHEGVLKISAVKVLSDAAPPRKNRVSSLASAGSSKRASTPWASIDSVLVALLDVHFDLLDDAGDGVPRRSHDETLRDLEVEDVALHGRDHAVHPARRSPISSPGSRLAISSCCSRWPAPVAGVINMNQKTAKSSGRGRARAAAPRRASASPVYAASVPARSPRGRRRSVRAGSAGYARLRSRSPRSSSWLTRWRM